VHYVVIYYSCFACNMLATSSKLASTVQWRTERILTTLLVRICVEMRLDSNLDYLSNSPVGEVAAVTRRIQCCE
jgi:hypothetical protein